MRNMSIRLRLTLLYSAILTVTLIAFGIALYVIQEQVTYADLKTNLIHQAEGAASGPHGAPVPVPEPPPAGTLPGRWTQTRNVDGTVAARTMDLSGITLPLSDAGLKAVQSGSSWFETAVVDNEPLLIYSKQMVMQDYVTRIVQVAAPIAEREQSLTTLRWILIAGSILVIFAAFAIGWVLSGTAISPIHSITWTAQAIGAQRDFSRRVEYTGPNDEIGQLARTFNAMLAELESGYRQVEQALQTQRRFVADASHELRTPLTTVRGNIELLRRDPPLGPQDRADVLGDAREEVERLIRLVNQLLTLARADSGRKVKCEPVAMRPLIEEVHRQARLLAPQRTIRCEGIIEATAMGNRDALVQVLLILMDNALVHTMPSATVSITTAQTNGSYTFRVCDTGEGIEPDQLPHIFERFYRGQVSRSGRGAGLGLSIAKELIEAQHGSITVDSRPGQGSEFTVILPLDKSEG